MCGMALARYARMRFRFNQVEPGRFKSTFFAAGVLFLAAFSFLPQTTFADEAVWQDAANTAGNRLLSFDPAAETEIGNQNASNWLAGGGGWSDNRFFAQHFARESSGLSSTAITQSAAVLPDDLRLSKNDTLTLTGAPGETVTLNLGDFTMKGRSTLTLEGTATTTFIINVTRQFSLTGSARVVLSGGLQWNQVFFNVLGPGTRVSLSGHTSLFGTITAPERTVLLSGQAIVYGKVFANKITIRNRAQIITPPVTSP